MAIKKSSLENKAIKTFALSDIVEQYQDVISIYEKDPNFIFDTVIIGGGIAGAGVLRDLSSRKNATALLCERATFGSGTSSKSGKAIHPGIRYLRMAFHRLMLAFGLRKDSSVKQSMKENLHSAWLDLKLVWEGTRERMVLANTSTGTVAVHPNLVFVYANSPERKWAVFFGIILYEMFTTLWAFSNLQKRYGKVRVYPQVKKLLGRLPFLCTDGLLGAIQYWDGKTSTDQTLVIKTIRDAVMSSKSEYPIKALCRVELVDYTWHDGENNAPGSFHVRLRHHFDSHDLPEEILVRAYTLTNAAGPWVDQVRNRTHLADERQTVIYSRGTHIEVTNKFIHDSLTNHPEYRVGLVPLNPERQHYLRPFFQNGIWYIQCTTTDRHHVDPDKVVPEQDEIEELMDSYNHLVNDDWKITNEDIFNVWCGIRPLAHSDPTEISVQNISRMYRLNQTKMGDGTIFDMINVKLTEYRSCAEDTGNMIKQNLQRRGIVKLGRSTTRRTSFAEVLDEARFAINSQDHPIGDRAYLQEKIDHYVQFQALNCFTDYMLNFGGVRDAIEFNSIGKCEVNWDTLKFDLDVMARLLNWSADRKQREWDNFSSNYSELFEPVGICR